MPMKAKKNRFSTVIPVYNHEQTVADVVKRAMELNMPVVVVDDGSTDSTFERIKSIQGIWILRHRLNKGKGAALMTGFLKAAQMADWAITLDADGQHNPEDARSLMRAIPDDLRPIVIGKRTGMEGGDVPWTSRFGRAFSNFWVRMAGGPEVEDSQSGFRVYPLPECMHLDVKARRFQFEVEILAKARWNRIPVIEAPVSVSYRTDIPRISHFRPFLDFLRNFAMFSRLITHRIFTPHLVRD
jgi:glycosyltransferase involved in cell wall biosynthesis